MMKHAFVAALIFVLTGCTTNFPDNPTPDELNEMLVIMNECLDGIIPLEKSYSRTCRNVEDALIAYMAAWMHFWMLLKFNNEAIELGYDGRHGMSGRT